MGGINERLQEVVDELFNGKSNEFARAIGLPPTTVANYLNSKVASKPSADKLEAIVSKTGVNGSWLLTGEGEMLSPHMAQAVGDISNSNVAGVNVSGKEIHISNSEAYNALLETVRTYQRITEKYQSQMDELIAILKAKL